MYDRLKEVKSQITACFGWLIGNRQLELRSRADLAVVRGRRTTSADVRHPTSSFRQSVGQMTLNERLDAQAKADRLYDRVERNG
jgi:hypothetical protein